MFKLVALIFALNSSLWAFDFSCQMPEFNTFSRLWESSPDFTALNFEGSLASERFKDLGTPGASFFSVITHNDWCRSLQDTIMCETPLSALAEIQSGETANAPKTKATLRYFLLILNYRNDGSALLRIRAQRTDTQLPTTFMIEFPKAACAVIP